MCHRARSVDRAGAEAREYIVALGSIEVAPGVSHQAPRGGETSASQHFLRAEPWLRVFLIGVHHKTRIGPECTCGPLPHIAHHLPASARGVAVGIGADLDNTRAFEVRARG